MHQDYINAYEEQVQDRPGSKTKMDAYCDIFQEQNKSLLITAAMSGLYIPGLRSLTRNPIILGLALVMPYLTMAIYFFQLISDIYLLAFENHTGAQQFTNIRRILLYSSFLFKTLYMLVKHAELDNLFQLWNESFHEPMFDTDRRRLLEAQRKKTVNATVVSTCLSVFCVMLFILPPTFTHGRKLYERFIIHFPEGSPGFELGMTFILLRALVSAFMPNCFDGLTLTFVSHISTQLTHLKNSLAHIVDILASHQDDGDSSLEQLQAVESLEIPYQLEQDLAREELIPRWVRHHQQVLRFCRETNSFLEPLLTVQISVIVLYMCLVLMQIAVLKSSLSFGISMTQYMISMSFLLLIIASHANKIMDENATIFLEAYGRSWFRLPPNLKSSLRIIMEQSLSPLAITTWTIYPLNMEYIGTMASLSYDIFTFMLGMVNTNRVGSVPY